MNPLGRMRLCHTAFAQAGPSETPVRKMAGRGARKNLYRGHIYQKRLTSVQTDPYYTAIPQAGSMSRVLLGKPCFSLWDRTAEPKAGWPVTGHFKKDRISTQGGPF